MDKKLIVEKEKVKVICRICNRDKKCKVCKGKGYYYETIYYHYYKNAKGETICIDGDTLK